MIFFFKKSRLKILSLYILKNILRRLFEKSPKNFKYILILKNIF